MNVFATTFQSVAVLLTVGFFGFIMLSRKLVPEEALRFLSPLAIDVSLPALIFYNIIVKFDPSGNPVWWRFPLYWALLTAAITLVGFILSMISSPETRPEFRASLIFQNGIFFPLGILAGVFGKDSVHVINLFFFTIFYPAFFFNTIHLFLRRSGLKGPAGQISKEPIAWHRVFNPVFNATLAGVLVKFLGAETLIPSFVLSSLKLVGEIAIPALFLILGGNIYIDMRQKEPFHLFEVIKFTFLKNILLPVLALGALILIRPSYDLAMLVMLECAVPPLTILPAVAEREGGIRSLVDNFMVASFLFALISVPVSLALFGRFFPTGGN